MQVCPSAIRLLLAIPLLNVCGVLPLHAAESTEPSGQQLAFSTTKGNCLACHMMPGDPAAVTSANIGPPLLSMRQRYPDRERLRAQIWDATQFNANTVMPPFGRHKVLSDSEIDKITDYIYGL